MSLPSRSPPTHVLTGGSHLQGLWPATAGRICETWSGGNRGTTFLGRVPDHPIALGPVLSARISARKAHRTGIPVKDARPDGIGVCRDIIDEDIRSCRIQVIPNNAFGISRCRCQFKLAAAHFREKRRSGGVFCPEEK